MISEIELAKFIKQATKSLWRDGADESTATWHIDLGTEFPLELGIAWTNYDDEPEMRAKICVFDDLPDYEWAVMPFADDGSVWDTEIIVSEGDDAMKLASLFIDEATKMVAALETGEIRTAWLNEDDSGEYEFFLEHGFELRKENAE